MSKEPRLYTEGADIENWNRGNEYPYNQGNINEILDPDGAKATKEITSIPSPFARIDVAKNAFRQVIELARKGKANTNTDGNTILDLEGKTIFHKTVSDVLDIAEIFFNYDKLKDKIEIITWSPNDRCEKLKKSEYKGHKFLGTALKTFWEADAVEYNFDKCKNIYLLNFKYGPAKMNIIGATSPSTLFFSSANDLSFVSEAICFGQYRPFTKDEPCPLYKRTDEEFILYLYYLKYKCFEGKFSSYFKEFNEYLEEAYKKLDHSLKEKIQNDNYPVYLPIRFSQSDAEYNVEILGTDCKMKEIKSFKGSDFEIQPTRSLEHDGILPLVLPNKNGNVYSKLKYTEADWGKDYKVDESCDLPLNERVLPYDGRKQPYLTCDDFLEETIICVKHEMNADHYFKMPLDTEDVKLSCLLPLKDEFFKYFKPEDLYNENPAVKITAKADKDKIIVTLEVPIRGKENVKTVKYEKYYHRLESYNNQVCCIDFESLVIPNIRMSKEVDSYYTLGLIASSGVGIDLEMDPYKKGKKISENITSGEKAGNGQDSVIVKTKTLRESNFEYLRITYVGNHTGVVIPKFREQKDNVSFDFAVDLGTSNTHIEYRKYRKGSEASKAEIMPFGYDEGEHIVEPLFVNAIDSKDPEFDGFIKVLQSEFLPFGIGDEYEYSFPIPTVLASYKKNTSSRQYPHEYKQIAFTYNKMYNDLTSNTDFSTNIKWENNSNGEDLRMFIKSLVLLIRNKVLMNEGSLDDIAIRWFYPNSMPAKNRGSIKAYWKEANEELLSNKATITSISESKGPLEFVIKNHSSANDVLSIDIGGGTTDVAFSVFGMGEAVTSFRFAGNSLFEDQLAEGNKGNGIVDSYRKKFEELAKKDKTNLLSDILKDEAHMNPANLAGFFFSFKDNKSLNNVDKSEKDFVSMLFNDDDFRIVFILFYSAILYHIGKIIKYKKYKLPRAISFSGNGSKVLGALTKEPIILADFTKILLEDVTGFKYENERLDIIGLDPDSNPKAHTCKGGLSIGNMRKTTDQGNAIEENIIMHSDGNVNGEFKVKDINDEFKVKDINDEYKESVIKDVNDFFTFALKELPAKFSYDKNFGINKKTFDIAKEECAGDLINFLNKGISLLNKEDEVSETLFFIPIKGVLHALSNKIFVDEKK